MEVGPTFDALSECTAAVASALLFDCGCHDDRLLTNVFFLKISALCCGVGLILNMPAPSINLGPFLLSRKLAFLNRGECI